MMLNACIIKGMRESAARLGDDELVDLVRGGDTDSFAYLLDRYRPTVFGIVSRRVRGADVEEVAQDIFVRAFTSLATYERKGEFAHWLSKIAVRACYDYWRQMYRRPERPMSSLSEDQAEWLARIASSASIRAHAHEESMNEARELLAWAMGKLSAEDRTVLELVHLEERPVREAAELLGWSVVNVKVRAHRARRKLRAVLARLIADQGGTT